MRVTRCYVETPLKPDQTIELPVSVAGHLTRVLRLGPGAAIVLFNGDGCDYDAELVGVEKNRASARIIVGRHQATESPLHLVLVQAVVRGEKMDFVLQKATELGVSAIIPILTEHTEVRLDAERSDKRHQHWLGVIASACGQSGRARLPKLARSLPLATWLGQTPQVGLDSHPTQPDRRAPIYYLHPDAENTLATLNGYTDQTACFVIGPEGGLGERDLAQLRAAEAVGVRLGPRILRAETAGLAVVAAMQSLHGDFQT